jgi:hypothetical protein
MYGNFSVVSSIQPWLDDQMAYGVNEAKVSFEMEAIYGPITL